MKINLIYFLFGVLLVSNCIGQKSLINIRIHGSNNNTIKYSNYIHNDYFLDLAYYEGSITKHMDSTMQIELDRNSEIFFRLLFNNQRGAILAVNPGDTIDVDVTIAKDSDLKNTGKPSYKISLAKSNYVAHNIYRDRFNPISKTFPSIDSIINESSNENIFELYEKYKEILNQKLKVWDSLLILKKISSPVYNLYFSDTKAGMNRYLVRYFLNKKARSKSSSMLNLYDSLIQKIFIEQGASDKYLLKTYIGSRFHETYLTEKIKSNLKIKDTLLKKIYENYFFLFDSTYRENAWGNSVLLPAIISPYNENLSNKANAIVFAKYYPNSMYLKKMNAIYDSIKMVRQKAYSHQEIILKNYNSLKEIFNFHKERFFFIDVWATWCAPCIGEFAYTSQLEKQLDSLKIKKIYLSIDERRDSTKWKEIIKKYYLNGYHYIADKKIQVEILEHLLQRKESGGLNIPQYFIFDKLKDKFYMNLSRPSSESVLYEEILKIVKME
ncbi:MAG TPA: hypothetical protein VJA82_14965 [Sediminibacterium sp.]|uniref:TlpA family protein disulfide reductase n=1 Tax=Sediminibacterium sp. TaxID=1917865 RepID=UPI0008D537F4|nr:hypothetical protein [Sediminibacterium sp.]OHC86008.1 MAG: hypothetical protein A2472_00010 [Sphingobacteriia bacterium RIFOXYC2_FULL_35_18]OHC89523.1 MAG: hypothetical protein A2546_09255 [Sphingobacteriia bacterium RIFOXYD2_FULL_35_12]HLD54608.1 hypothetical protein [Sediminibacterium sp.]